VLTVPAPLDVDSPMVGNKLVGNDCDQGVSAPRCR
jgi:hypothetical protein